MNATLIDHMGSDLSVVNAARVSFGKRSEWEYVCDECGTKLYTKVCGGHTCMFSRKLSEADQSLISFLARGCTTKEWEVLLVDAGRRGELFLGEGAGKVQYEDVLNFIRRMPPHWTPFGHTAITLHIKAPIFIARQLGKHQVGFVWNEVSRRYVDETPEFYKPPLWYARADNVKQGGDPSNVKIFDALEAMSVQTGYDTYHGAEYQNFYSIVHEVYKDLLDRGIAPEQARMILPQSMYTEWYWTGNLYGFANMYNQRTDAHAQYDTRLLAKQIGEVIEPLFPVSWAALTNNNRT